MLQKYANFCKLAIEGGGFSLPGIAQSFLILLHNLLPKRSDITLLTASSRETASGFLNRQELTKLKLKAIRAGVWFRSLPRIDRVLVDLTIKVTEKIHSVSLAKSIFSVVGKLEAMLESRIMKTAKLVGRPLAEKISLTAQKWGNSTAANWATDQSFAFFLAVMHINR